MNESKSHWSGDASLDFSYYQADYISRSLSAETDLSHKVGQYETLLESSFDNQTVALPGATSGISRFRYDANLKWKYFYAETPYFSYLSPRFRHNDAGTYTSVQALRIGGGRKIAFEERHYEMTLEVGVGYRYATLSDREHIQEELITISTKALWNITPSLSFKFKLTHEQSKLEKYRTTTLELRNKLTENFSLKTQFSEKRTYPYDVSIPNGELLSSIGISYDI